MSELDSPFEVQTSDKDLSANDNEALFKLIRKYRKKLRQIEKLETSNKELSQEEREKLSKRDDIRLELSEALAEFNNLNQPEAELLDKNTSKQDPSGQESFSEISINNEQDSYNEDISQAAGDHIEACVDETITNEVNQSDEKPKFKVPEVPKQPKKRSRKPKGKLRKAWKQRKFEFRPLEGHNDIVLDVSVDRNWIISASRDTTVKLWDSKSGDEIRNLTGHSGCVTCIKLIDEATSDLLRTKVKLDRNELGCDLTSHQVEREQLLLTSSTDCSIRMFLLPHGHLVNSVYNYSPVISMCFHAEAAVVFAGSDSGKITSYSLISGKLLFEQIVCDEPITSLECSNTKLVATSDFGEVFVWKIMDGNSNANVITTSCNSIKLECCFTLEENDEYLEGRQCISSRFVKNDDNLVFVGDDGINLKVINISEDAVVKFPNHVRAGFTDSIQTTDKFVFSTSFDADTGNGSINIRSMEKDSKFAYLSTLTHNDLRRILCCSVQSDENGLFQIVTGGNQLLRWQEITDQSKQDDVSDDEVVRIRGSYLADLTRAPQNSDFDSDTSDEDSVRGWFWQQPKTSNKHDEEVVTNDSDIMTSSSEGEVEGDSSSLGWCNIL